MKNNTQNNEASTATTNSFDRINFKALQEAQASINVATGTCLGAIKQATQEEVDALNTVIEQIKTLSDVVETSAKVLTAKWEASMSTPVVNEVRDGVSIAYEYSVLEGRDRYSWDESCAYVRTYCAKHNATHYAKPADDFSIADAVALAKREGKSYVVVDNLS